MKEEGNIKDFERKFLDCDNKFDTIFKLTSVASKIIAEDLTILRVNDALAELLGYTPSEMEGTKILEYACEEYKEHWHKLQMELWYNEVPFFKLLACLYKKDQTVVWVNVTSILFKDEGKTYGFTVLDDVTGLKHLQESEKRLNMALKYSKLAVWELDLSSKLIFRSESHDEIFGYDKQQENWTLDRYAQHVSDEDLPRFKAAINAALEGNQIDQQVRLITTDGTIKWVNFQATRQEDASGRPKKMLGTIADITKDKLQERHKDDFISIASHELKTPVTSLKASLQLLERLMEEMSDRAGSMVLQANKSVNKIMTLVDDLLNASKSYKEQLHLKKTTFNLYKAVEECCGQLSFQSSHETVLDGPEDLEVNADAERIERVMINLLTNAIKYGPDSKKIHIYIRQTTTMAKVSVVDQGIGIAPEKIPVLFDRYYQADQIQDHYSGLGLGLFISAEIIKKHGGEIGVDSIQGKGSTFWFTIPII
jgi:two-component system CheB/CheR fusion protein